MADKMNCIPFIQKITLPLMVIVAFSSCLSIKPGGVKSGKCLFETFYVGTDGTQYFIKPLSFAADDKAELKLDFTFRQKNINQDTATVNVSFYGAENFKAADSLVIKNGTSTLNLSPLSHMFSETTKSGFMTRFTAKTMLLEVRRYSMTTIGK